MRRKSDIEEQYAEASAQFGPNYPKVQHLLLAKQNLDEALERAKKNVVSSIEADYRTGREREDLLLAALDRQKAEANEMAEKLVQYHILEHDAESNKQLYDNLQQKLKEAGITAGLRSSNIRIVDPALAPTYPSRPQKSRNILLAFLVGLVGGVGLALLREYLDNTVKSPDDIERLAGLPSLAVVPEVRSLNGHGGRGRAAKLLGDGQTAEERRRIARGDCFVCEAKVASIRCMYEFVNPE